MSRTHDEYGEPLSRPEGHSTVGSPISEHRLIGSVAWQDRREALAAANYKRRNELREVANMIAWLPEMEVTRINSSGETETGKALDATLVNKLEVETALRALSETERHVVVLVEMEGMSYREVASARGASEESIRQAHSRALRSCRGRIYDPREIRDPDPLTATG